MAQAERERPLAPPTGISRIPELPPLLPFAPFYIHHMRVRNEQVERG